MMRLPWTRPRDPDENGQPEVIEVTTVVASTEHETEADRAVADARQLKAETYARIAAARPIYAEVSRRYGKNHIAETMLRTLGG